jgi:hypothetical protein
MVGPGATVWTQWTSLISNVKGQTAGQEPILDRRQLVLPQFCTVTVTSQITSIPALLLKNGGFIVNNGLLTLVGSTSIAAVGVGVNGPSTIDNWGRMLAINPNGLIPKGLSRNSLYTCH